MAKTLCKIVKPSDMPPDGTLLCFPVEGKGYKNIINLPDWLNKP
jgi:hypothetical protein